MAICKCGLSSNYPECDGTHGVTKNQNIRNALIKAFEENVHLLKEQDGNSDSNQ